MAAVILKAFTMFCGMGWPGKLCGSLFGPLIPLAPINVSAYIAIFCAVYFTPSNVLNGNKNLKRSLRNAFFIYWPTMVLIFLSMLQVACKTVH
jgi:fatty acid desaturase